MNVNGKGSVGEALVLAHLTRLGYFVFKPFSDHAPVDLIVADHEMRLARLQVKYRKVERGKIILPLHSVINGKKLGVNPGLLDAWAIYNPEFDVILYARKSDLRDGAFSVRVEAPKRKTRQALPLRNLEEFADPARIFES